MKTFLFVFFSLINISFFLIPLWDLEKSSKNLLFEKSSINITIFNETKNSVNIVLIKNFIKEDMNITDQNYIYIIINNEKKELYTNWENIERFYISNNEELFICPEGKNFINKYINSNNFTELIPKNFNNKDNGWDLLCYYNPKINMMIQVFLNRKNEQFFYTSNDLLKFDEKELQIIKEIFDYISYWNSEDKMDYNLFALLLIDTRIMLYDLSFNIKIIFPQITNQFFIDYKSTYTKAYFDHNNKIFYWMSANSTSEFRSGIGFYDVISNEANVTIKKRENSPFNILYYKNARIKVLDMIRNTRFIYYEIEYNKTNSENIEKEIYYGIIDIILNQIIFNTNEKLIKFQPLKNYSMLAFTKTNVYEICAIKENGECVNNCSSGKLILDTEKGNYCENEPNCKNYSLIIDNISVCVNNCDQNFFVSNGKICGLCKNMYGSEKPYKLINKEGCIDEKPENTYYINKNMRIIDYCDSFCKKCSSFEKCDKCYMNYKVKDGKCVKKNLTFIYIIVGVFLFILIIILIFMVKRKLQKKSLSEKPIDDISRELKEGNENEMMENNKDKINPNTPINSE